MDYEYENNLLLTEIRDILQSIEGAVRLPLEQEEYEVVAEILDEIRSQGKVEVEGYDEQGTSEITIYTHTQLLESGLHTNTETTVYDEILEVDVPVMYRTALIDSNNGIDNTISNVVVPFFIIIIFIIGMRWLYDR